MRKSSIVIKGVLAVFCLIGGLGNIGENTGAAIFGVVLGVAFAAWLIIGLKKAPKRRSYADKSALTLSAQKEPAAKENPIDSVEQCQKVVFNPPNDKSEVKISKSEYCIDTEQIAASLASKITIQIDGYDDNVENIVLSSLSDAEAIKICDYIVLDIETTGLNRKSDKIIEISWVKYENFLEVQRYNTLINPEQHISDTASRINGITDNDVKNSPTYSEIKEIVASALLGNTVVGHNVANFDLAFIKRLIAGEKGRIDYIDTMTLAKHAFPGLKSYSLEKLCSSLALPISSSHRALVDVLATNELFLRCRNELSRKIEEEKRRRKLEKERIAAEREAKFANSPLLNVTFAFTGEFEAERKQLENLVNSVGALKRDTVSGNTDYLVVGKIDNLPDWALQRKYERAKELQAKGKKVKLISEKEYSELINAALDCLSLS